MEENELVLVEDVVAGICKSSRRGRERCEQTSHSQGQTQPPYGSRARAAVGSNRGACSLADLEEPRNAASRWVHERRWCTEARSSIRVRSRRFSADTA